MCHLFFERHHHRVRLSKQFQFRSNRGSDAWSSVQHSFYVRDFPIDTWLFRNYVNAATAASQNLTFASSNTFILRADHMSVLSANGPGRNSVRIRSNKVYTTHVAV